MDSAEWRALCGALQQLREVNVCYCRITDDLLQALASLPQLQCLDLTYAYGYTETGVIAFAQARGAGLKKVVLDSDQSVEWGWWNQVLPRHVLRIYSRD